MDMVAKDTTVERQALAWMDDPLQTFGLSHSRVHSVPREEAEAVQLAALNLRLEQRRAQIVMLGKLAEAQGITCFAALEDAAPLLFTHDVYKSYPTSLLAKQRFDQLTKWLGRLTPYDLSGVDTAGCASIDAWLERLREQTELDVATSSGTSGTMSFFPKSQRDYRTSVRMLRMNLTQTFGEESDPAAFDEAYHVLTPFYRDGHSTTARLPHYFLDVFCKGDASLLHTALPYKASADLMWMAARLRAAQAKGDGTRVDVPESLLARRAEWETLQTEMPRLQMAFVSEMIPQLTGERVMALGITAMFFEIARNGLETGAGAAFAPGSAVVGGGGGKGMVLPDDAEETIARFFGVERMRGSYGMTEQNFYLNNCEHDRYHIPPWVVVLLLDGETGQPLPREGVQTGRASFFDVSQDGAWGGIFRAATTRSPAPPRPPRRAKRWGF
ncbi:MAG: hypothetical protein JF595_12635 [Sphingomonadales bacterium]|nr:hypothetical protein [Sphingomonadales bacterium]